MISNCPNGSARSGDFTKGNANLYGILTVVLIGFLTLL